MQRADGLSEGVDEGLVEVEDEVQPPLLQVLLPRLAQVLRRALPARALVQVLREVAQV